MGVWERSPASVAIALNHPELPNEFRAALPDFQPADVAGSPYSVHRYVVDERFGGTEGLETARAALARRNMGLILDFVPNHVAVDHPWTVSHPDYFIHDDSGAIANGRDPYFPPWTDTAQTNIFQSAARAAMVETLRSIAAQCDGVRCDMAMLELNSVFEKTWGGRAGAVPATEFWDEAIPAVCAAQPGFVFIAEVYWGLEAELQKHGFDYCYDKQLYDRLGDGNAPAIREHLRGDGGDPSKLLRFIENHDETRAAARFGGAEERAAAAAIATLPGARLFHQGQFEGRKVKAPVQLCRWRDEPADAALAAFYRTLLAAARLCTGEWNMCDVTGWPDNASCENLLAWCWRSAEQRALIVINYSQAASQGIVHIPWSDLRGRNWTWRDPLTTERFDRSGDDMAEHGLYVARDAWQMHFLVA